MFSIIFCFLLISVFHSTSWHYWRSRTASSQTPQTSFTTWLRKTWWGQGCLTSTFLLLLRLWQQVSVLWHDLEGINGVPVAWSGHFITLLFPFRLLQPPSPHHSSADPPTWAHHSRGKEADTHSSGTNHPAPPRHLRVASTDEDQQGTALQDWLFTNMTWAVLEILTWL